ncbi:MAG: ABC transporter permease [Deltaproteobacteria bacterium]|nr:ABC transporter permease [Deltaproteobacteria bacterium]
MVLVEFGGFIVTMVQGIRALFIRPFRINLIFKEAETIGVNSTFIILLTGLFTGAVLALQSGKAFRLFNAEGVTGAVVALSLFRELGPVMTGLMIAARSGSSMAAQIGTMRVTQQIDALEVMAVDPVSYLIAPRIIAAFVMVPLLSIIFDMMGIFGSYLVGVGMLEINEATFFEKIEAYVKTEDMWDGLIKAAAFGIIIAVVGCRKGFLTEGGAEGVGRATTQAVVIASVTILIADYFLTAMMF